MGDWQSQLSRPAQVPLAAHDALCDIRVECRDRGDRLCPLCLVGIAARRARRCEGFANIMIMPLYAQMGVGLGMKCCAGAVLCNRRGKSCRPAGQPCRAPSTPAPGCRRHSDDRLELAAPQPRKTVVRGVWQHGKGPLKKEMASDGSRDKISSTRSCASGAARCSSFLSPNTLPSANRRLASCSRGRSFPVRSETDGAWART